jgi:hypothetical protein
MRHAKPGHHAIATAVRIVPLLFPIAWLIVASEPSGRAVPSYSRQTGMPCATCH